MLLPLSWLREFVPYEGTAEELGDRLTMLGLEMDGLERPYEGLAPFVVGHVLECGRHPDAEKLSVTRVDVGSEILDIVCGAPNVAQGQKVVVAPVGVTMPDGMKIKKSKLRGAPSNGMICSERELGISEDHDGIMVLDPAAPVGRSILEVLPFEREILDISITPNRGDCLSILGLAREVAAAYNLPLTMPSAALAEMAEKVQDAVSIELTSPDLSPLYLGRVLQGVGIAKSSQAIRYRLHAVGVRSISNLVDVTNYILMELGQPLHAFDLDTVADSHIIVRPAVTGEKIVTLDGQQRVLEEGDICIADKNGVLCLGGVMGGLDSEITASTSRVFLESAVFAPWQIRRTKRRLGLNSEAAFRFERGVDQTLSKFALDRAAYLMAQCSGGTVLSGVVGSEPKPWKAPVIGLSRTSAEKLLGVELTEEFCEKTLTSLGCSLEKAGDDGWKVTPPCRQDLLREADLIEELARVYGVDKVPAVLPSIVRPLERAGLPLPLHKFLSNIKDWGVTAGLNEAINYSFTSHKILDMLGTPEEERTCLGNPLSEDLAVLRPDIVPGLLSAMKNCLSHGASGVRLFEVAGVFHKDPSSETTVQEPQRLGVLLTGHRHDRVWPNTKGDFEYIDIKGVLEHLASHLHLSGVEYERCDTGPAWMLPAVAVKRNGVLLGYVGRIKPEIADVFLAKKDVWYAELSLNELHTQFLEQKHRFVALTVYPAMKRDITFTAGFDIASETICNAIKALNIDILEDVMLIDSFEPESKDERHLTFRVVFRHADRTLKDKEVDKRRTEIVEKLAKKLGLTV